MEEIKGQIAKVVDPYTVVINRGYEHGVEGGMCFIIYTIGDEIIDPENGMSLGEFEYVKAKVKTTYVTERYSVAETYEQDLSAPLENSITSALYNRKKVIPSPYFIEQTARVNVGDLAKEILD